MVKTGNIESEIKGIIAEILEIEPEKIAPQAKFVEDLGMDSMMALEIVAAIEKKYKIVVPEDNLTKLATFGDVIEVTQQLLSKK